MPASRGRRSPALIPTTPTPDEPEGLDPADYADVSLDEQQHDDAPEGTPDSGALLYPGAIVTQSATVAVRFDAAGTSFLKYAVTDRVQEEESHLEVYERLATAMTGGLITLIDDTQGQLEAYQKEIEQRNAAIQAAQQGQLQRR